MTVNKKRIIIPKFQSSYLHFVSLLASSDLSSADNLCKQFGPRSGLTEHLF